MPFYKKKPVIIEARKVTRENIGELVKWIGPAKDDGGCCWSAGWEPPYIQIKTLEGLMKASENDFIIKGVNGEFYPCKPDIFEKTYEFFLNDKLF